MEANHAYDEQRNEVVNGSASWHYLADVLDAHRRLGAAASAAIIGVLTVPIANQEFE